MSTKHVHLKKAPVTDLRGGWSDLKIWGNKMALVERRDFNPQTMEREYIVFLSNVPANPRLVGTEAHFSHGNETLYDQPFSYHDVDSPRYDRNERGQLDHPVSYWVPVKFKDLFGDEPRMMLEFIREQHYREVPHRYPLTAAKWKKLLAMSFDETQDLDDYDMSNAAYELGDYDWDSFPGVYALNRRGDVKWIVSRKTNKRGL
jgi:hypothetical protein